MLIPTLLVPTGRTYWIVIDGFALESGEYTLAVSCPTGAIEVGTLACGATVTGNTSGTVSHFGFDAPEDYWMFTAPYFGMYNFNTCGSTLDTYLYVFTRHNNQNTTIVGDLYASCKHFSSLRSLASPARTHRMLPI
jgi:hypothetical protein